MVWVAVAELGRIVAGGEGAKNTGSKHYKGTGRSKKKQRDGFGQPYNGLGKEIYCLKNVASKASVV